MSNSVPPHRRQPTRLPRPWDSPGKNIGMGCHFLLQCIKVKSESEVTQSCPTLSDPMDWRLPGSSVHGIFQARVLEWGAIAFSGMLSWGYPNLKSVNELIYKRGYGKINKSELPRQTTHWLLHLLGNTESSARRIWFMRSIPLENISKKQTTSYGPLNCLFHELEWRKRPFIL